MVAPALVSLVAALIVAGVFIRLAGADPFTALASLFYGSTGLEPSGFNIFLLAQSLARATPLLLVGIAVSLGLRAGMFNIGAQGQMTLGALAAAIVGAAASRYPVSPLLLVPLLLGCAALAGAVWAAIPGWLRTWRGVHEVITTILFNYIAINLADYLVTYHLRDPASIGVQTREIARAVWLSPLVPGSGLTAGFYLALACTALFSIAMKRTVLGYEIRAVGLAPEAARVAGIAVSRIQVKAMAVSGALAGLAGALEVLSIHHRFLSGVSGSYGFDGIAVALLGGMNGLGVAVSALFFGCLLSGANYMQMQTSVPAAVGVIVQAVIIAGAGLRFMRFSRKEATS